MVWREKIQLGKAICKINEKFDLSRHEDLCPDEAKELLAKVVEKSIWLKRFSANFRGAKSIAEVNRIIEQVYNRADQHRVWCGLPF